ncbi:MAG: U32 family peptidase [Desulfosarcina sp.]|nr:U32 family peptidase [Desulfobacterales bacterium]
MSSRIYKEKKPLSTLTHHSRVELLAPAGNFEKLEMAIHFGADAVYLGGKQFSLRSHSGNFSEDEMEAAVSCCHRKGVRAYVTCNIFPRNDDLPGIRDFLQGLGTIRPDGIIVSDPAVFLMAKELIPAIPIHVSTQANTTSYAAARFWKSLGADRINAARELSLEEIRAMCTQSGLALEVFVHGAMCMAYSGRCLLSSFLSDRDGNRGRCAHPCRWNYALVEEKRPGLYMPVHETERGSFVFNSRDLCMIAHIPRLIETGVRAFKIEGRMKGIHYVAAVVKAYREAIDAYYQDAPPDASQPDWARELEAVNNRGYGTGFYFGNPSQENAKGLPTVPGSEYRLVGKVLSDSVGGQVAVETRNRFFKGDTVEILSPGRPIGTGLIQSIHDTDGMLIDRARPGFQVHVGLAAACRRWGLLRTVTAASPVDRTR